MRTEIIFGGPGVAQDQGEVRVGRNLACEPYLLPEMLLSDPALGFRGRQVLAYVARYIDRHGNPPGYTSIMRDLDFADRANVSRVVHRLAAKGLLCMVKDGRRPRIRLSRDAVEAVCHARNANHGRMKNG